MASALGIGVGGDKKTVGNQCYQLVVYCTYAGED